MYGSVDVVLQWLRKFKKFLVEECGFVSSVADPYILYYWKDGKLLIVMSVQVERKT